MVNRFKEHFVDEEQVMKERNYKGLVYHKHTHDAILAKCGSLSAPMKPETIDFIKEW